MASYLRNNVLLGEEIKKARIAQGLTKAQAAEQAGLEKRTYARVESGCKVNHKTLSAVLEALDLSLDSKTLSLQPAKSKATMATPQEVRFAKSKEKPCNLPSVEKKKITEGDVFSLTESTHKQIKVLKVFESRQSFLALITDHKGRERKATLTWKTSSYPHLGLFHKQDDSPPPAF